jgi:putative DNA primase/helicase
LGATADGFNPVPCLRFDDDAEGIFLEWRQDLERDLHAGEMMPALESHLAKYRKLIPTLALIFHLADCGKGDITKVPMLKAVLMGEYLRSHANRAYASGPEAETAAAKAILARIRKGDLQDGFTARDIHQKHWARLSDRQQIQAGLDLLCDLDWVASEQRSLQGAGRKTTQYRINPKATAQ